MAPEQAAELFEDDKTPWIDSILGVLPSLSAGEVFDGWC
jgi:hypothetical protein